MPKLHVLKNFMDSYNLQPCLKLCNSPVNYTRHCDTRRVFSMFDNILVNNTLDFVNIIDEVKKRNNHFAVLFHSKFDNVNSSEVKPIDNSKPIAGVCGHYIWSD